MFNSKSITYLQSALMLGIAAPNIHAALNDTGITWCANATKNNLACPISGFPRQDGDFGRDVTNNDDTDGHAGFSFTKLDSQGKDLPAEATSWDCVRDNVTGMIWENKTSDGKLRDSKWTYTWYKSGDGTSSGGTCYQSGHCDTEKYVQDVNTTGLCGFKDWRMPSPTELASIVDYSEYHPAIDTDYFSNTVDSWFWASSPYANNSSSAWCVDVGYGYVDYYNKNGAYQVRLVHGEQYSLLFEDLKDGTVVQTNTGLIWAKCAEGLSGDNCQTGTAKALTWKQALQAASNSRLGDYDDWRLPNVKELQSLVDYSKYAPAIDLTYFPNTPNVWFWTSSPGWGTWYVSFDDGDVSTYFSSGYNNRVRFVRNGQFLYFALNVTTSGAGTGTVTSDPAGIDCGATCNARFQQNASVTLTATADSDSTFIGWSGDCSGTDPCSVKMDADKSVTAVFINFHAAFNDTGITWCDNASQSNLACPVDGFPRQDGEYGRDVTDNDNSDGHAGFSFTKLDSQGKDLPATATSWDCVRDNVTGMIWENKTSDGGLRDKKWDYSWYNSSLTKPGKPDGGTCYQSGRCDTEKYTQDVNKTGLCGFNDWRMPSPTELHGIVDYGIPDSLPRFDANYFVSTKSYFWTSLPYVNNASYAWCVGGHVGFGYKTDVDSVLLVHGRQYSLLFEDLKDGTVAQTNTGLMWAKCAEGLSGDNCQTGTAKSLTWQQAFQAANDSRLGGYNDWRLPNIKELQSIVDYSKYAPAIDLTYFPNTPILWFWVSASFYGGAQAFKVNFDDGDSFLDPKDNSNRVRFVRGGSQPSLFALNVTNSGDGLGTVTSDPAGINCGTTCNVKFQQNWSITLTATASSGSTFGGWSGAGCSGTGTCVVKMSAAKKVTATFTKNPIYYTLSISKVGNGTVVSDPTGINCGTGTGCSASYPSGTSVMLNATPDNGYQFDGWSGSGCNGTGTCTVTMRADLNVTATFNLITPTNYLLTVTKPTGGLITSSDLGINCGTDCKQDYPAGTLVNLTATPDANYQFLRWGGDCRSETTSTCIINMNQAHTVTAFFKQVGRTMRLTVSVTGKGTVTSDPTGISCNGIKGCVADFAINTPVTLTATAPANYSFFGWQSDFECSGSQNPCQLVMSQRKTVQAIFKKIEWKRLTVTNNDTERGTVTSDLPGINCGSDCTQLFPKGTVVAITATAKPHFAFAGWDGKACINETGLTCRVTMNGSNTVSVKFNPLPRFILTVVTSPKAGGTVVSDPIGINCGAGTSDCTETYESGTQVSLTATAKEGYVFDSWEGDACAQAGSSTVCVINLTQPTIVTANFVVKTQ